MSEQEWIQKIADTIISVYNFDASPLEIARQIHEAYKEAGYYQPVDIKPTGAEPSDEELIELYELNNPADDHAIGCRNLFNAARIGYVKLAKDQNLPDDFYDWCQRLRNGQIDGDYLFGCLQGKNFRKVE